MNINYEKIAEIHGTSIFNLIKDNINDVVNNFNHMVNLGFEDVDDIFERYTPIFICEHKKFKDKLNKLFSKYNILEIEENLTILEELDK